MKGEPEAAYLQISCLRNPESENQESGYQQGLHRARMVLALCRHGSLPVLAPCLPGAFPVPAWCRHRAGPVPVWCSWVLSGGGSDACRSGRSG